MNSNIIIKVFRILYSTTCITILFLAIFLFSCQEKTTRYQSYSDYPVYEGLDLGLTYSVQSSQIKIWAPTASEVRLRIYNKGTEGKCLLEQAMQSDINGCWKALLDGDWKGKFYTIQANINNQWMQEVCDPYARAVGVNGKRAAIINLADTDPRNWEQDKKPELKSFSDIILYELHCRDISISPYSGIKHKGKYLGLTEIGTTSSLSSVQRTLSGEEGPEMRSTGLSHINELGVTHLHLLPCFDFSSIDETKLDSPQYNWGYDPQNYNVPEGSYSTDPYNPFVRINEFKQMVQSLHQNGLRLVMDVVYNHSSATKESAFNQLVPGYYYRQNSDSSSSNASGCGNEIASERPMVRKFIIESVKYWAQEYHVDGFRFDLMGIHDIETMNQIRIELDKIDSSIFMYGEGWTAGHSPYPAEERALKNNMGKLNHIAAFCDDLRDGIKGSWSDEKDKGFVSGKLNMEESIKFGVVAAIQHPQIKYELVNYSNLPWAKEPYQCINYTSCHDDLTLWDKLVVSASSETKENRIKMYNLANAIVLTSQGIPFLHAGVEMARTKYGDHNSYKSADSINQLNWERKKEYQEVYNYYKNLIALRKAHPAFRIPSSQTIQKYLFFLNPEQKNIVSFLLKEHANKDTWRTILVIYNANPTDVKINIPEAEWNIITDGKSFYLDETKKIKTNTFTIPSISMLIAHSD